MMDNKSLLDQLMGEERDVPLEKRKNRKRHFSDPEVCKYYICGLCPYQLFKTTKSDLGPYDKIFDDDCKAQWEALDQEEKDRYPYEKQLRDFLQVCNKNHVYTPVCAFFFKKKIIKRDDGLSWHGHGGGKAGSCF